MISPHLKGKGCNGTPQGRVKKVGICQNMRWQPEPSDGAHWTPIVSRCKDLTRSPVWRNRPSVGRWAGTTIRILHPAVCWF
ncbi:hypothetical protein CesoFtcFv8_005448 [Champsocephalus esox]|uniref:Uncharacterized protein n=1 Tax=Champsocephalus esox TaxID=159716 RepID=A0AAN8CPN5_9TELE|nr:hypothetical protein CesoFtcFv8_005448 [Champsocephalus esox]